MQMDHQDQTYELFWKQVLRWLVNTSPDPVMISSDKDTYLPGETVHLSADISNKSFERMNNAKVGGESHDAGRRHRNHSA